MMRRGTKTLLVIVAISLVVTAWYAHQIVQRGFSANDEPSALERAAAQVARDMAVPLRARNLRSPFPASPDNLAAGREHFADHCAGCHANDGSGDTMFGNGMYPKPPDLRLARTQGKSDGELYYTIENGVRLSGMPAFGKRSGMDDADTWKLVAFIRHLPHLTPEEQRDMESNNPKSDVERQEEQEEERFLNGGNPPNEHGKEHHH